MTLSRSSPGRSPEPIIRSMTCGIRSSIPFAVRSSRQVSLLENVRSRYFTAGSLSFCGSNVLGNPRRIPRPAFRQMSSFLTAQLETNNQAANTTNGRQKVNARRRTLIGECSCVLPVRKQASYEQRVTLKSTLELPQAMPDSSRPRDSPVRRRRFIQKPGVAAQRRTPGLVSYLPLPCKGFTTGLSCGTLSAFFQPRILSPGVALR